MDFHGLELVCPACRGDLIRDADGALRCPACAQSYPVILGIPDLRLWPDPYISMEDDRAKGLRLAGECAGLDFEASVLRYYAITDAVPPFQARRFTRSLLVAAPRAAYALDRWEAEAGVAPAGRLLEIGCGTAALLQAGAARYSRLVGVDVAFRWLILAKKRLEQAGLNLPLVCACAEALPFPDRAFDRVVADSTLEHLRDQPRALRECWRTLDHGGAIFITTPNRFSLGPDPHVGLPAGGMLPESFVAAYVRRKGGVAPKRTLLSAARLRQLLEGAGFQSVRVSVPDVSPAQRASFGLPARTVISAYRRVRSIAFGRSLMQRIGPLLDAVAHKPAGGPSAGRV